MEIIFWIKINYNISSKILPTIFASTQKVSKNKKVVGQCKFPGEYSLAPKPENHFESVENLTDKNYSNIYLITIRYLLNAMRDLIRYLLNAVRDLSTN